MKSSSASINWLLATAFVFFQFGLQLAASVFNHQWAIDFSLDHVQVSLLSAIFFVTYLLMQLPVGMIYSRYPIKPVMGFAILGLALSCFWLAHATSYAYALIARALMGVTSSFGFIGMVYVSSNWFKPKRFTLMLALSEMLSMVSLMVVLPLLSYLLLFSSWQSIMQVISSLLLLLAVGVWLYVHDRSSQKKRKQQVKADWLASFRQVPRLLKIPQLWVASFYGFFMFSIICAFTSLWGVSFIEHTTTLSRPMAAQVSVMVLLGTAIGAPLSSVIAGWIRSCKRTMMISSIVASLVMAGVVFVPHIPLWLMYVLYILVGVSSAAYIHSFDLVKQHVPRALRSEAMAITNMLIMICAPFYQVLIGGLLDNHFFGLAHSEAMQYRLAIGVLPLSLCLSIVLMVWIKEKPRV